MLAREIVAFHIVEMGERDCASCEVDIDRSNEIAAMPKLEHAFTFNP